MLVLTRKLGEKICIDNEIEVIVLGIQGNRIRLGIKAPQSMFVLRSELIDHAMTALPSQFLQTSSARVDA